MNVSLTPRLQKFIRSRVAAGLYSNSSEVVRDALLQLAARASDTNGSGKVRKLGKPAVRRAILRREPYLRTLGVSALYLFGSFARGRARPESDIDVLIETDARSRFSLLDQVEIQNNLQEVLGRSVDVVLKQHLRRELRKSVLGDAERVF